MNEDSNVIRISIPKQKEASDIGVVKFGVGRKCRGRVVNFKPYGFFVETEDGHFGLVHGKNIRGWDWSQRFDRVFRHGSEVDVTVIDIEDGTDRMSFSCEIPEGALPPPEPVRVAEEPPAPPPTRREIAETWVAGHADDSASAYEWLRAELTDGPIYGPLTNVLCDRFGVPVPASQWIRLFPEFVCYSGRGDNPSELPAVALVERVGDAAYWNGMKIRADELVENRNRKENAAERFGELAARLDGKAVFPGAKWILDYMEMSRALVRGQGLYGTSDVVERLAIPMLGQLGWDVSPANAALVRGGEDTFDIRVYGGTAASGNVSVAVKCAPAGTDFGSPRSVVEHVLGLYNRLGGDEPASCKVVWTNGREWVVFTRELLTSCIAVLAEHRGAAILDEALASGDTRYLRRVTFPAESTPFGWLAAFDELHGFMR